VKAHIYNKNIHYRNIPKLSGNEKAFEEGMFELMQILNSYTRFVFFGNDQERLTRILKIVKNSNEDITT
jgi:hypothetical protein